MGLTTMDSGMLRDWRIVKNTQHTLVVLLCQWTFGRLAGYEDTNDAEQLAVDLAMRYVVGGRAKSRHVASTSQMGRFEIEVLTQPVNKSVQRTEHDLNALVELSGQWIDRVRQHKPINEIIMNMDSSVSETYGRRHRAAPLPGTLLAATRSEAEYAISQPGPCRILVAGPHEQDQECRIEDRDLSVHIARGGAMSDSPPRLRFRNHWRIGPLDKTLTIRSKGRHETTSL